MLILKWRHKKACLTSMHLSVLTLKTESLYGTCSPEWGVVSYGACQNEAINNLQDDVRAVQTEQRKENL